MFMPWFLGAIAARPPAVFIAVNITNQLVVSEDVASSCTAGYRLLNTGQAQKTNISEAYVNILGEWETGGSPGSEYDVRATAGAESGVSSETGTYGVWQNLSATRTWTITRTPTGVATKQITIEIRNATTLAVLDTAVIDLEATVST